MALIFFEAPWAVYSVVGAVGPRAAAAPVALPLEIGGSRLCSSRLQGTSLHGVLRFHETCHVELDKLPKIEKLNKKSLRLLVEFGVFEFCLKLPASLFTVRPIRCK